uniref:Uncharacterized protein n=1 Tax=Cacopsylla melanoneura TaxID=428564 RepID=A0A8D9F8E8_9HEMI
MWTFTIDIKDSVDFFFPNLHRSTSVDALWTQLNTSFFGEIQLPWRIPLLLLIPTELFYVSFSRYFTSFLPFSHFFTGQNNKICVKLYLSTISKACCKSINGLDLFYESTSVPTLFYGYNPWRMIPAFYLWT